MRQTSALVPILGALVVLLIRPAWGGPPTARAPHLAWSDPAALSIVGPDATEVVPHPGKVVALERDRLLAIPIRPGDRVQISGSPGCVGFDFGQAPGEATVWETCFRDARELRVPSWTSATRLVVRSTDTMATFRVQIAQPEESPMAWYRTDEAVLAWLDDASASPPWDKAPDLAARETLSVLAALKDAWLAPHRRGKQNAHLLHALWLERAARHRPLRAPFAHTTPIRTPGDWDGGFVAEHATSTLLSAPAAEIVTLLLEGDARYETVVRIFSDDRLVAQKRIRLARRSRVVRKWSVPSILRLVVPDGKVRIEVVEGRAKIRARAYGVRPSLIDARAHRARSFWKKVSAGSISARRDATPPSRNPAWVAWQRAAHVPTRTNLDALWRERQALSPLRRLVILHELTRLEQSMSAKMAAASEAARLAQNLDPARVAPIFVSIHDELARAGIADEKVTPAELSRLFPDWDQRPTDLDLLRATLLPPDTGRPSRFLARAENLSLSLSYDSPRLQRLREAWRSATRFTRLSPREEVHAVRRLLVPNDGATDDLCSATSPSGAQRWTYLDTQGLTLDVPHRDGYFERVVFWSDETAPRLDDWALVDDTPVPVHLGAGIPTTIAVTTGRHRFRGPAAFPVLAKIPRSGRVPCDTLRTIRSWSSLKRETVFRLEPENAFTVGRLVFAPAGQAEPVDIRLRFGQKRTAHLHFGQVRKQASGSGNPHSRAAEFLIPAGISQIRVQSSRPIAARLERRVYPEAKAPSQSSPSSSLLLPRAALDEDGLIDELESLSRELQEHGDQDEIRRQRALVLERLGYGQIAERDWARIDESLRGSEQSGVQRSIVDSVIRSIVPLGVVAKIEPLPPPRDPSRLQRALQAYDDGVPPTLTLVPLRRHFERQLDGALSKEQSRSTNETLLLAVWARQVGDLLLAARAFERIGLDHQQPIALEEADELRVEFARSLSGVAQKEALQEALLRSAESHLELRDRPKPRAKAPEDGIHEKGTRQASTPNGDVPPPTLEIVPEAVVEASSALQWHLASRDRGAGTRIVSSRRFDKNNSKAVRVRRALVGAEPGARLFSQRLRLGLQSVDSQMLHLEARCLALSGPSEICSLTVEVDGQSVECPPADPSARGAPGGDVVRCDIPIATESHRLTVSVPESVEALAWAKVTDKTTGSVLERRTTWSLVEPTEPVVVTVRSPALLKLKVRPTRSHQTLTLEQTNRNLSQEVSLATPVDRHVRIEGEESSVFLQAHEETMLYFPLRASGGEVVRITSDAPALVRIESAHLGQLEPVEDVAVALPGMVLPDARRAVELKDPGALTPDPRPGALTAGLSVSYEWPVLDEADGRVQDRYLQTRLHAAREVVPSRVWIDVGALNRARFGPASWGGDLYVSASSRNGIPGAYFRGLLVSQGGNQIAWGGRMTLGTLVGIRLDDHFKLIPSVSYTARRAGQEREDIRQDIDVYSRYAITRPRSVDGRVHLDYRGWVDGLLRSSTHVRMSPDFDGVDQMGLSTRARLLPGAGWAPFWDAQLGVSYRPVSPQRSSDYVRTSLKLDVVFWRWLTRSWRLSLSTYGQMLVDFRPAMEPQASAGVSLAGDWVRGRGMADFAPFSRPFRHRWEEGAAPIRRAESRGSRITEEDDVSAE